MSKTFGTLLDPLRHIHNPDFGAVIFRRTTPEIREEGAIWDESMTLYPLVGAKPREHVLDWTFPSGASLSMSHMEHEKDKLKWQGSAICGIYFEEVTHFAMTMFFYMLSRNRSTCGIRPYMRATMNPDPHSWVKLFLAPWLQKDYPYPAKSGEIRYFYRDKGQVVWVKPGEYEQLPERIRKKCKSVTFIKATIYDNKKLLEKDPEYLANLENLPLADKLRLLDGDWDTIIEGTFFKRQWFLPALKPEAVPADLERVVRFWDFAATEPNEQNPNPDWTAGVKMGRRNGIFYILDVVHERYGPGDVDDLVLKTAMADNECYEDEQGVLRHRKRISQRWEEEPGSSGKRVTQYMRKLLAGFDCNGVRSTGSKSVRARPLSSQAKGGNVRMIEGWWNDPYLNEMCVFVDEEDAHNQERSEDEVHDDMVDGSSGAFGELFQSKTAKQRIDWAKRYASMLSGTQAEMCPHCSQEMEQGQAHVCQVAVGVQV